MTVPCVVLTRFGSPGPPVEDLVLRQTGSRAGSRRRRRHTSQRWRVARRWPWRTSSGRTVVVVEPVLRAPAVHDGAPTPLVDGFSSEENFGAVQQAQDIESLLGRERRDARPRRRPYFEDYWRLLEGSSSDPTQTAQQRAHRALGRHEFGVDVGGHGVTFGLHQRGDARGQVRHRRRDGVEFCLHTHRIPSVAAAVASRAHTVIVNERSRERRHHRSRVVGHRGAWRRRLDLPAGSTQPGSRRARRPGCLESRSRPRQRGDRGLSRASTRGRTRSGGGARTTRRRRWRGFDVFAAVPVHA
jgi:hypothetical protein